MDESSALTDETLNIVDDNNAQGTLITIHEDFGNCSNLLCFGVPNHSIRRNEFDEGVI